VGGKGGWERWLGVRGGEGVHIGGAGRMERGWRKRGGDERGVGSYMKLVVRGGDGDGGRKR